MSESADRLSEIRVRVIGKGGDVQTQRSGAEEDTDFQATGSLVPPFSPEKLADLYEDSGAISQNVAAYETNVDGFGYVLEPVVDFDSDAGRRAVARSMANGGGTPSEKDVDKRIGELREEAESERQELRNFLDYVGIGVSFTTLRKRTRKDVEVTGNGYWEVLRDDDKKIVKLVHVPSHTVRLLPLDKVAVPTMELQRSGFLDYTEVKIHRRYRRYVQNLEGSGTMVFFKEFGDPRVVSCATGEVYESVEEMNQPDREPDADPATEMIHFSIYSPSSSYGVPRWSGTLPSVLGSMSMEDVNLTYFDNKGVPPMAVLVSGGVMSDKTVKYIEDVLEKEIKGKKNFHKVLVLEATTEPGTNVSPKIELKPLMNAVLSDAVFQNYDERNIDKIGSSFRLPRLVRGDVRDFNKSTAWASIRFAEEQVFAGERDDFDFVFNRSILTDRRTRFWRLVSKGPTIRDPETVVTMLTDLARVSALSPNEVRSLAGRVLGMDLPKIEEEWASRPPAFTLAGRGYLPGEEDEPATKEHADGLMDKLMQLQEDVAGLVVKVEEGMDAEDLRQFKQTLLGAGFDVRDLYGGDDGVPSQDEGADADSDR